MPDENPIVVEVNAIERDVLYLLTGDDLPIWSVWDLARATERGKLIKDTIRSLRTSGLVHPRGLPHGADRRPGQLTPPSGAPRRPAVLPARAPLLSENLRSV